MRARGARAERQHYTTVLITSIAASASPASLHGHGRLKLKTTPRFPDPGRVAWFFYGFVLALRPGREVVGSDHLAIEGVVFDIPGTILVS